MTDVMAVEGNARSTIVLAHTGQIRPGGEVLRRMVAVTLELDQNRLLPHQAHVPTEDIEELWQLVEARST
jgi:hypothetical protein